MISLYKIENTNITPEGNYMSGELRGLSSDDKPTEIGEKKIANGSVFIEIDTGKMYMFDLENEEWKEL